MLTTTPGMHEKVRKQHLVVGGKFGPKIPARGRPRDTTVVIERPVNGGMHRQKQFRRIKAMLDGHGYGRPRLYHLVLMSDIEAEDAAPFLKPLKALCLQLRSFGIATRWRAALERDDEKGLHMHVFILTDASLRNTDSIINTKLSVAGVKTRAPKGKSPKSPAGWMRDMFARHGINFYLSQPKADMHRSGGTIQGTRLNYARPDTPERIADCIEWISYLAKARSKPDDVRGIYFSSRDSKHVSQSLLAAA